MLCGSQSFDLLHKTENSLVLHKDTLISHQLDRCEQHKHFVAGIDTILKFCNFLVLL